MSRNSSRGSLFTKGSDKKVPVSASIKSISGSETKSSVPASPMKTEFTSEPPIGMFKSHPIRTTARELKFDTVPESPAQSLTDNGMMFPTVYKETSDKDAGIDQVDSGKKDSEGERIDSIERPDLMESFSMETLPKMMEDLQGNNVEGKRLILLNFIVQNIQRCDDLFNVYKKEY